MLGFVDGGTDFSKIVVPKSFIGSIEGKLDNNVSTNVDHTVVWNAADDWNVGFGEIEMAVLAKDDRDLLNLHFLSLPTGDNNASELVINRSPLNDSDLLPLWYWHLAKGNEDIIHNPSENTVKLSFDMDNYDPNFLPTRSIAWCYGWMPMIPPLSRNRMESYRYGRIRVETNEMQLPVEGLRRLQWRRAQWHAIYKIPTSKRGRFPECGRRRNDRQTHVLCMQESHGEMELTTGESSVIKVEGIPTICLRTITSPTIQTAILKPSIKTERTLPRTLDLICPR